MLDLTDDGRAALDTALDAADKSGHLEELVGRLRTLDSLRGRCVLFRDHDTLAFVVFGAKDRSYAPLVTGILVQFSRRVRAEAA